MERKMIWDQIMHTLELDDQQDIQDRKKASYNAKKKYHLNADNPCDYLTQREKECMDHLILGKTIKETAILMQLSPRTVEFYLKNIRKRWGCKTKGQIIEKIQKSKIKETV